MQVSLITAASIFVTCSKVCLTSFSDGPASAASREAPARNDLLLLLLHELKKACSACDVSRRCRDLRISRLDLRLASLSLAVTCSRATQEWPQCALKEFFWSSTRLRSGFYISSGFSRRAWTQLAWGLGSHWAKGWRSCEPFHTAIGACKVFIIGRHLRHALGRSGS